MPRRPQDPSPSEPTRQANRDTATWVYAGSTLISPEEATTTSVPTTMRSVIICRRVAPLDGAASGGSPIAPSLGTLLPSDPVTKGFIVCTPKGHRSGPERGVRGGPERA